MWIGRRAKTTASGLLAKTFAAGMVVAPVLAYADISAVPTTIAALEPSAFSGLSASPLESIYDDAEGLTAVYDITSRVVVMPDGTKLEAHSGLGERADNPRFVYQRMRGSTPPALYDLVPLKRLFHGVAALRLQPISGQVFGRTDLLAHTYMLHGRPESEGCVVFRDYAAFLEAFRLGRVKRLRVVPANVDAALRIAFHSGGAFALPRPRS